MLYIKNTMQIVIKKNLNGHWKDADFVTCKLKKIPQKCLLKTLVFVLVETGENIRFSCMKCPSCFHLQDKTPPTKHSVPLSLESTGLLSFLFQLRNKFMASPKSLWSGSGSHHGGGAGDALDGGTSRCAADGVKDVERVWKDALHAVFHWTDLEGMRGNSFHVLCFNI